MKRNRQSGFTLVELLVTVTVGVVLMTMAVPAFRTMIQNNRITTQANALVTALNLARSEAIKRADAVTVCPSADQATCAGGTDWASGWIVFTDPDEDATVNGADVVLRVEGPLKGNPTLTGPGAVTYLASGRVNAAAVFNHTIPDCVGQQARTIDVTLTGRPGVTTSYCTGG